MGLYTAFLLLILFTEIKLLMEFVYTVFLFFKSLYNKKPSGALATHWAPTTIFLFSNASHCLYIIFSKFNELTSFGDFVPKPLLPFLRKGSEK